MAYRNPRETDGNKAPIVKAEADIDHLESDLDEGEFDEDQVELGQKALLPVPLTLKLSRSLVRKLTDNAREEGVTMEELAAELVAEGVVLRAWEIVEKKAAMRGGNSAPRDQGGFNNRQGNSLSGNQSQGNHGSNHNPHAPRQQFQGGNKMAQKKLQRQARQHANAMDLMSDKAAFLEYVRNQEKKRR